MSNKILIISNNLNATIISSLIYKLEQEGLEYILSDRYNDEINISNLICINIEEDIDNICKKTNLPIICIQKESRIIENYQKNTINYVLTNLVDINEKYTDAQKDFLFKNGIFSVVNQKVFDLLENYYEDDGIIIDLRQYKKINNDWTFKFSSISETYRWLLNKDIITSKHKNAHKKAVNFASDKVYNETNREIKYLINKLNLVKNGMLYTDIFLFSRNDFNIFKKNYFFKMSIKYICDTYKIYFIDKDILEKKEKNILLKFLDGIFIYEDCIYRDTYNDEYSLGYIDCNKEIVKEYNDYFDYIVNNYGIPIASEEDLNDI